MKDFEDTDREGAEHHMSYQHKPLTVAEIEELMERIETALALHHEGGPLAETPLKIPAGAYRALVDAKRLLSLLTPPTDAEVREAVGRIETRMYPFPDGGYGLLHPGPSADDIRTLLRAVQAPRLTGDQEGGIREAEAALSMQPCCCGAGFICTRCLGMRKLRAAFPGLFGKEG